MKLKLEKDKLQHLGACAGITVFVSLVCNAVGFGIFSIFIGAGVALIVGVGKEVYDGKTGGHNDPNDVKADIIGVMIGAVTSGALIGIMGVI